MGGRHPIHIDLPVREIKISSIHIYNLRSRDEAKKPQNPDVGGDEGPLTPVVGVGKGYQLPVVEAEENSKRIFLKKTRKI